MADNAIMGQVAFALFMILVTFIILRAQAILPRNRKPRAPRKSTNYAPTHLLIVLGSGGHTGEMLSMIRNLDVSKYTYRTYLISSDDKFSATKARDFESSLRDRRRNIEEDTHVSPYRIVSVPRARVIHQPIYTTPFSCLKCIAVAAKQLLPFQRPSTDGLPRPLVGPPDLMLTNGPATGLIVVIAAFVLRFFDFKGKFEEKLHTVYVESFARVGGLSLSGKIIENLGLVDRFFVQWEKGLGSEGHERVLAGPAKENGLTRNARNGREWRGFLVE